MRRLALFTLVALAPSYIVTQHGGEHRPPSSGVQRPPVTYVSAKRQVPTSPIPIPALQRPDVSGSKGNV